MYVIFVYPLGLALAYLLFFRLALPFVIMARCEQLHSSATRGRAGALATIGLRCGLLYLASTGFGLLTN